MFYLLLLATSLLLFVYLWKNRKPKHLPPGPPCLPVVGCTPFITGDNFHLMMEKWRDEYGPVVGLMLGTTPAVAIVEPRTVLEVLRHDDFQGRPKTAIIRDRTFGESLGVFFSDGPYWVEQKRFTLRHLRDFGFGKKSMEGLILEEAEVLVDELKKGSPKTIQVSMHFVMNVVNVLWHVMTGVRHERGDTHFQNLLDKLNQQFRNGDVSGSSFANLFPSLRSLSTKWRRTQQNQRDLQQFVRSSIRDHEKSFDADNMRDFIDVYIREMQLGKPGSTFNEKSLISICMDLFGAGAESVSNTIGFSLLYLVRHPEVQAKIHAELDQHVGRNRRVTIGDKVNLVYVEATLLEVMRINSIAPTDVPHRATRDTTIKGYFIPKDTLVMISLWCLLHDEDHWGDPKVFRPERHIDADGKLIVKDEYMINFGVGKRVCLGEPLARHILFLFFATIMQELTFTLPPGHELPSTLTLPGFTVAPRPFEVVVTERA